MEQAKEKPRFKQTEIGAVPEDWDVKELKELTELITDGKHGDCQNQLYSGYYFLSAKDVFDGRLDYSDAREITKEDFVAFKDKKSGNFLGTGLSFYNDKAGKSKIGTVQINLSLACNLKLNKYNAINTINEGRHQNNIKYIDNGEIDLSIYDY